MSAIEILVLQGRTRLGYEAADLRYGVLLVAAKRAGDAAQLLFRGIEQLGGALLRLRKGPA